MLGNLKNNELAKSKHLLKILADCSLDIDDVIDFVLIKKTKNEDSVSLEEYQSKCK